MRTDAFWSRVERRGDDECWNWQGARNERGYGRWRGERAHRLTYALANGIIPAGLIIRHKCDNPRCVNPGHLEPGTHKENTADCLERGRFPIGATHGNTKLTDADTLYIRENPERLTGKALAQRFGVSESTISYIRAGKRRQRVR